MLLAASTQRTIGLVILAIVFIGGLVYLYFNIRSAREEIGSEIELASNRKPYLSDEELEGKKLDLALGTSLALLTITAVTLPLYWLGEPGRHEGRDLDTWRIFTNRGEEIYVEGAQCVSCHGPEGSGGAVSTAITSDSGEFIAQVSWKAPAIDTVLSRYTEDEVLHTLNYGRNGVMPAWGAGGGGPLTDQQLEEILFYLRNIQITEEEIREQVASGVEDGAKDLIMATSAEPWAVDLRAARAAADEAAWAVTLIARDEFGFDCAAAEGVPECDAAAAARDVLRASTDAASGPLQAAFEAWWDDVQAAQQTAVRARAKRRTSSTARFSSPTRPQPAPTAALAVTRTAGASTQLVRTWSKRTAPTKPSSTSMCREEASSVRTSEAARHSTSSKRPAAMRRSLSAARQLARHTAGAAPGVTVRCPVSDHSPSRTRRAQVWAPARASSSGTRRYSPLIRSMRSLRSRGHSDGDDRPHRGSRLGP
jgi:mono/diheme cytochrome c family protein